MDQDPVFQQLVTILTEKFEVPAERVRLRATLGELDLDSLAVVELYVTLQEHWDIPLDDSAATGELTLDQVTDAVAELLRDRDHGTA